MNLEDFISEADILEKSELEKVKLLAFYKIETKELTEFSAAGAATWLTAANLPTPNTTRLKKNLQESKDFIKGSSKDLFKLHATTLKSLKEKWKNIHEKSELIITDHTILPGSLYSSSRGYVKQLCDQINASYHYNIFDGCAVLMRRLLEILLIHSFEHSQEDHEIRESGQFIPLEQIIAKAKNNTKLSLSRDTKNTLDTFRELGNFSAHKIHYNCRRPDIEKVLLKYRATIEELMYKANLC